MKLKNKLIKEFTLSEDLKDKNQLYSNYIEHDTTRKCFVMVDTNDIVICNEEYVLSYQNASFEIFGTANTEEELNELIKIAEVS